MKQFKLMSVGKILSEAEDVANLDWSALRSNANWEVWFNGFQVATVDWFPAESYAIQDGGIIALIPRHDLIVPTIRGALIYKHIFNGLPQTLLTVRPRIT